ncbi:hypothetical protein CCR94_18000 [Rhodoblastus sphagnicola]|uniref:BioF2-like acetyltransferase domain-containing protein n=1 Tax=Rhodoblastus sphagnicola TaxID=333368 RepID=A0A2S6N196_9HYPH|nr:GNAT family N-acetyltransferase [Rhodoblastus sphagnicola]MBB4200376.1 hypothetical protein [Rhodoblastus sphagnicola]PPQ28370.1 hypothetical protein CCR94_18000 [Rhodoblastus sphagnicola]
MTQFNHAPAFLDETVSGASTRARLAKPDAERGGATLSGDFRLQVLRSRDEIEPFRAFWTACAPGRDCDLDFYLFVTEHIEGCLRPHVVVLFDGESPVALLAGRIDAARIPVRAGYVSLPVPTLKILRIVHGGFLGDLNPEHAQSLISSILEALKAGEADAAMLESIDLRSPLVACARTLAPWFCADRLVHPIVHRFRDVTGATGAFLDQLSVSMQARHRRRRSKLKRAFKAFEIKRYHQPDCLSEFMATVESIAAKSYQRGIGVGFSRSSFIEARLAFEARKGWLRGFVLCLDGQPSAFWIGSLRDEVFISTYLAFDPAHADYAPGMYLLLEAMDALVAEAAGARLFDFGPGDAVYKEQLSNRFVEESPVYIFAPRLKPLAVNALRSAVGAASHAVRHSRWLAPLAQKLKRWLRSRAAEGA